MRNPEDKARQNASDKPWVVAISVVILTIYFAATAASGLHAYFTGDDAGNLLNMHQYWAHSASYVVGAALRVVSGAFRPLGGVYYFTLFKLAGFNPLPFRIVCLVLMLANLMLAFRLIRRLSGSLAAAMVGATLIANHPVTLELLYSSGTIYEILCFLFYFLALYLYFVWRQAGDAAGETALPWRRFAIILILTGCALDSKEMAMTLPAALALIELIYFPPTNWSKRTAGLFVWRQGRVAMATAALVLPTIAVKVLTKNPLSDDTRYHSHSVQATVDAMRAYHHFLLYGLLSPDGLSTPALLVLWTVMAVMAIGWRSRSMQFGLCFLVVGLLPVCLIAPRGGYMSYLPLLGWALYCGSFFERLMDDLVGGFRLRRWEAQVKVAAFIPVAILIANTHARLLAPYASGMLEHQGETRRMIERLKKLHPQLPHGAAMLLVDDPLTASFELVSLAEVAYGDPTLELDRIKMLAAQPGGSELTRYDVLLAGGWDFYDVRGIHDPRPPVEVHMQPAGAGNIRVEIPEFAGQAVDLASRRAVQHCTLDASGACAIPALPDGKVHWVRSPAGDWMSAASSER